MDWMYCENEKQQVHLKTLINTFTLKCTIDAHIFFFNAQAKSVVVDGFFLSRKEHRVSRIKNRFLNTVL